MSREVYGLIGEVLFVPPGGTQALLVSPVAGECASTLKYFAGGSCEIYQAPLGTTAPGTSLAVSIGNGYLLGTSESYNISGAARYYLIATGATATIMHTRGLSEGY